MRLSITILSFLVAAPLWGGAASDIQFEDCRKKLIKAQKLDVLHELDWKLPKEPKVVVGRTFIQMPIDGKEGFAETVNCFLLAGESGKCVNFSVLHWQTGKAIGRLSKSRFKKN